MGYPIPCEMLEMPYFIGVSSWPCPRVLALITATAQIDGTPQEERDKAVEPG
jgi:hypothetical protein